MFFFKQILICYDITFKLILVAFSSLIDKDFEVFHYSIYKVYLSKDEALLVSYLGQQPLFAIFYVTSYGEYKERENKSFFIL